MTRKIIPVDPFDYVLFGGTGDSGEGDTDAGIFVLGMITGAAFAHNFALAAKPDKMLDGVVQVGGVSSVGMTAVLIGTAFCLIVGFTMREKI